MRTHIRYSAVIRSIGLKIARMWFYIVIPTENPDTFTSMVNVMCVVDYAATKAIQTAYVMNVKQYAVTKAIQTANVMNVT